MGLLPYRVTLAEREESLLEAAQEWCLRQWSNTAGATWYSGFSMLSSNTLPMFTGRWLYTRSWSFQREEDEVLFRMAWV